MSEDELQLLTTVIRERQRCMADDRMALRAAQAEVTRFERAIDLDQQVIDDARRRISDHWTAKFDPTARAAS